MAPTNYTTSPEELDHFVIQVNPVMPLGSPDLSTSYAVVEKAISFKEHVCGEQGSDAYVAIHMTANRFFTGFVFNNII